MAVSSRVATRRDPSLAANRLANLEAAAESVVQSHPGIADRIAFAREVSRVARRDYGITLGATTLMSSHWRALSTAYWRLPANAAAMADADLSDAAPTPIPAPALPPVTVADADDSWKTRSQVSNRLRFDRRRREYEKILRRAAESVLASGVEIASQQELCRLVARATARFGRPLSASSVSSARYWPVVEPFYARCPSARPKPQWTWDTVPFSAFLEAFKLASRNNPRATVGVLKFGILGHLGFGITDNTNELVVRFLEARPAGIEELEHLLYRHIAGSRSHPMSRRLRGIREELLSTLEGADQVRYLSRLSTMVRGGPAEMRFLVDVVKAGFVPEPRLRDFDKATGDYFALYHLLGQEGGEDSSVVYYDHAVHYVKTPPAKRRADFISHIFDDLRFSEVQLVVFCDTGWEGRVALARKRPVRDKTTERELAGYFARTSTGLSALRLSGRTMTLGREYSEADHALRRLQGDVEIARRAERDVRQYLSVARELCERVERWRTPAGGGGMSVPRAPVASRPQTRSLSMPAMMSGMMMTGMSSTMPMTPVWNLFAPLTT